MRALIDASASRPIAMAPFAISLTNSFTSSRPRSRAAESRVKRPSWMIWSSRFASWASVVCACAAAAAAFCSLAIATLPAVAQVQLGFQLGLLLGVRQYFVQHLVQLVVALQAAAQVRQSGAQVQQILHWLDLLGHRFGREVVQALEADVDLHLCVRIVGQLIRHAVRQVRVHRLQHLVEVVGIYLDELPVLQCGQRLGRLTGEVPEYAHHEGKLLHFNGVAGFNLVSDLDSGWTYTTEFLLGALFGHLTPHSAKLSAVRDSAGYRISTART